MRTERTERTEPIIQVAVDTLRRLVEQNYLTMRAHPQTDLLIWNYTQRAQYDRYWTQETLLCRGLITRRDGTIVARPFPKFFNLEEYQGALPIEDFEVTEKMDGSLGILYWIGDAPAIATRGSFESEQAVKGTKMLRGRYAAYPFDKRYTYLFEIIYPENRIVVDYGAMEDLILLAVIETATGNELSLNELGETPFPTVRRYDGVTDLAELRRIEEQNKEGFVVRFPSSGLRLKLKYAEYARLHRLLTQVNARTIWKCLAIGAALDELLDRAPDEFYGWVRATEATLLSDYARIEGYSLEIAAGVRTLPTRKQQAEIVMTCRYPAVVFKLLNGKPHAAAIWKLLRPAAERPFRVDVEG